MVGKTERVVLVKGDVSKWYHQAIFIVNPNVSEDALPVDFVAEAEKIIHEYNLKRSSKNVIAAAPPPTISPSPVKKNKSNFIINILMLAACIGIAAVLALRVFS